MPVHLLGRFRQNVLDRHPSHSGQAKTSQPRFLQKTSAVMIVIFIHGVRVYGLLIIVDTLGCTTMRISASRTDISAIYSEKTSTFFCGGNDSGPPASQ